MAHLNSGKESHLREEKIKRKQTNKKTREREKGKRKENTSPGGQPEKPLSSQGSLQCSR